MTTPPLALDTIVFARGLSTPPGVRPALQAIDLDVLPGEIFSIVGSAGSGKTALLEALVGLRHVTATRFVVCGHDPQRVPRALKQRIGAALTRSDVERKVSVIEALRLFALLYDRADPEGALTRLELGAVRHARVEELPPPLRQRVSLALALVHNPVVLFADEPTHQMDPEGARLVWELLRERRERGRTTVLATNRLDEAAGLSDRLAILQHGRMVAVDTPTALIARSTSPVRVTFELLKPEVALESLAALDAVVDARMERASYVITSRDGHATLRAVLRLLDTLHVRPLTINLRQQTLEDVFFELTAGAPAP